MCSVDDVRVHANPKFITDLEILSIISSAETNVLTKTGSTDTTNTYLIQAVIHAAAAITLKRARAKGELASNVETPESKISITGIIEEIKQHEEERDSFIKLYLNPPQSTVFASPTCVMGFNSWSGGC